MYIFLKSSVEEEGGRGIRNVNQGDSRERLKEGKVNHLGSSSTSKDTQPQIQEAIDLALLGTHCQHIPVIIWYRIEFMNYIFGALTGAY